MKSKVAFVSRALLLTIALLTISAYARPQEPDFSKVEIKTTKITDSFYTLEGQGGMIGILVGPDGVFMVDTQFAPLSEKIAAAIKQITNQPIRFIVNTHVIRITPAATRTSARWARCSFRATNCAIAWKKARPR